MPIPDFRYEGRRGTMQRIRIVDKPRRPKEERSPILPLSLRDPDVARAKSLQQAQPQDKRRS